MRIILFLLIFSNFLAFADVTELSVLWLKSGASSEKADQLWKEQNFPEALKLYNDSLNSLENITSSQTDFYPEIVEATVKRLTDRRAICEVLAKPLEGLSSDQLKEIVRQQRSLLVKSIEANSKSSVVEPKNRHFYLKLKALQDQVYDLKSRLNVYEDREFNQGELKKQRQILEAETAGCMVVAHNMLSEYQSYSKDFQEIKQRLKVVSLQNHELVKKLELSENVELLKSLKKELDLMRVEAAKVVADRDALKKKYELALNLLKGDKEESNTEGNHLSLAKIEIKRLNAMLDVLQISNLELRERNAKLVKRSEKVLEAESEEEESPSEQMVSVARENIKLKLQLEELNSEVSYLKGCLNRDVVELAIAKGGEGVSDFPELKNELQLLKEKLLRQKSVNRLLLLADDGKSTELLELLRKQFPKSFSKQ